MDLSTEIRVVDNGNLKAYVTLIIDNEIAISGFRVLSSKTGDLFVAAPSHKGKDKEGNEAYFDDVRFIGDREEGSKDSNFGRDCKDFIISQYKKEASKNTRGGNTRDDRNAGAVRAGRTAQPSSDTKPALPANAEAAPRRQAKPLPW